MKLPRDLLGTMTDELLLEMRVALVERASSNILQGEAAHCTLALTIQLLEMAVSVTEELVNRSGGDS